MIDAVPWHWEVVKFGHGQEAMIAFHGFDNSAEDWMVFEPALGDRYTLYCIQLFYHGESYLDEGSEERFDAAALCAIFEKILEHYDIRRFSLLGFSLGGRICLELIRQYPERINHVFLLAADGLRMSRWYLFLTSTMLGNRWFRKSVEDPALFLSAATVFKKAGIVGEKQYKFAWSYFNTDEKRKKVYDVWMVFRRLRPDRKSIVKAILKNRLRIDLIFGKKDSVIPVRNAKK